MSRLHVKVFVAVVLFHAAVLLFGGLLLFRDASDHEATREVDLISTAPDEEKKPDEKEPEEAKEPEEQESDDAADLAEVQQAAPDLSQLSQLEAPIVPALTAMSLDDLESALNPDLAGGGGLSGGFSLASGGRIGGTGTVAGLEAGEDLAAIVSVGDLDQRPRALFQSPPSYPQELRKRKIEGTVEVVFLVDTEGRVTNPRAARSTDPAFERPALEAVRQWRFEAGTRGGEKVSFKMKVPITFKAS